MKFRKVMSMILAAAMIVSLAACGSQPAAATTAAPETTQAAAVTEAAPAAEAAPAETEAPKLDFPKGNIVLTLGNSAGSGGDIFCRSLAEAVAQNPILNGYSIVVENRTGASGANAMNYVKEQKGDGYNVLSYTTSLTINEVINDLPIGPLDFKPICSVVTDDQMIIVKADSKWQTINDLVDDAIANPDTQVWGRGLPSGASTLSQLIFLSTCPDVKVKAVPYDGGGELITALLGGHVDVITAEYAEAKAQIDAGLFRPLCVLAENRQEKLADVPTAKEMGFDAVVFRPRGFLAPADTPDEIVNALADIFKASLDNEAYVQQLKDDATTVLYMGPEEFGTCLAEIKQSYEDIGLRDLAAAEASK